MKKFYLFLPVLLIISSFGPYISLSVGLRVEHLIIYPLSLLFILLYLFKRGLFILKPLFLLFIFWFSTFSLILMTTCLKNNDTTLMSVLPDIENFMQPIALMSLFMVVLYPLSEVDMQNRLEAVCKTVVVLHCLNSLWIIAGFMIDTTPMNTYFWGGGEHSTAANAMQMGRYSGIFNQPSEAGMTYSIALLAWLYLLQKSSKLSFTHSITLIIMIMGGLVTVSKIFILGGIPLFLLACVTGGIRISKLLKVAGPITILTFLAFKFLETSWDGMDYLLRLFDYNSQTNFLDLFTAGRYGEGSQQGNLFAEVYDTAFLLGTGFGQHPVVDSGFFHFFGNGGIIGLLFYLAILLTFVFMSIHFLRIFKTTPETRFFIFLTLLIIGGSFGVPVLVLNRVSIILWVIVCLLLQYFCYSNTTILQSNKPALLNTMGQQLYQ